MSGMLNAKHHQTGQGCDRTNRFCLASSWRSAHGGAADASLLKNPIIWSILLCVSELRDQLPCRPQNMRSQHDARPSRFHKCIPTKTTQA